MRYEAQKEQSKIRCVKKKEKRSGVKVVNGFTQCWNRREGIFLPSLPEQTGTPVLLDRDIFTPQTLSGA